MLCLAAAAAGCGGGDESTTVTVTTAETQTETETETVTQTESSASASVIPEPVQETWAALSAAAETGDYERLRPLVPEDLSYTFGGATQGGAIAYWQRLEDEGVSPIAILADLLATPLTYYQGNYVWPFAFPLSAAELIPADRELLREIGGEDLSDDFIPDGGYLGWRVGISPDGDWVFFIAGD